MQNSQQTQTSNSNPGIEEMNGNPADAPTDPAPLYASPWLAFFYLIRQGLDQFRP